MKNKLLCFLLSVVTFFSCSGEISQNIDKPVDNSLSKTIQGADFSSLPEYEDAGTVFYDEKGDIIPDLIPFFAEKGLDCVRLRLWLNPEVEFNGKKYCNLENTLNLAKRVVDSGMDFMLDIHYSDTWTDPAHQKIPSIWENQLKNLSENKAFDVLKTLVYDYTKEVLESFKSVSIPVKYIQIGNEITNGFLWPYGKVKSESAGNDKIRFQNTFALLKQGIKAVREISPESRIILHLDCSGNLNACQWWFDAAKEASLDFDIIGLSYYSLWHGTSLQIAVNTVNSLRKRYQKDVFIVETAYPFTLGWNDNTNNLFGQNNQLIDGYPATREGQIKYYKDFCELLQTSVCSSAVFWWEPLAVSSKNTKPSIESTIENTCWFDFNNTYLGLKFK